MYERKEAILARGTLQCRVCEQSKPLSEMVRNAGRACGYERLCSSCKKDDSQAFRATNPESARASSRNYKRRVRYAELGISEEGYQELLRRQKGRCAICKKKPGQSRLAVDHDHTTGVVRGLLCKHCNQALGHFRDNVESLKAAIRYLTGQVTIS